MALLPGSPAIDAAIAIGGITASALCARASASFFLTNTLSAPAVLTGFPVT